MARRVSTLNLDTDANSQDVAVSGDHIFAITLDRAPPELAENGARKAMAVRPIVHSFAVGSDGALRTLGQTVLPARLAWYGALDINARGGRAFVNDSNQLHVIDTTDPSDVTLTTHDMPGWNCQSLQVDEAHAWCAMGKKGVLSFEL